MKKTFYKITLGLAAVLGLFLHEAAAQTYSKPGHYYGCGYTQGTTVNWRYAAIEEVEIWSDGVLVYKKEADGCNDKGAGLGAYGHFNLVESTPAFNVVMGATYQIKYRTKHYINSTTGASFIGFLDLNGDKDFGDAYEHISSSWASASDAPTDVVHTESFTVPCTATPGASRLRLRSEYYTYFANTANEHSTNETYGETEDYTITIVAPPAPDASIFSTKPAYVGIPHQMFAKTAGVGTTFSWNLDQTNPDYERVSTWALDTWNSAGSQPVYTKAENCGGTDLETTWITVNAITMAPDINFIVDQTVVKAGDDITITDLSKNGVETYTWTIFDSLNNPVYSYDNSDIQSGFDWNPVFNMPDKGLFTVCLEAENSAGISKRCKTAYVKVGDGNVHNIGGGVKMSESGSGMLYDNGGPGVFYSGEATLGNNSFLINPCSAKKITLNVTEFDMADDNDILFVFDGMDQTGTPLHPTGGFNRNNVTGTFSVSATSGSMFIYYISDKDGFAEGFAANWTSDLNVPSLPLADFKSEFPTVYADAVTKFTSTSTNLSGFPVFGWEAEGKYGKGESFEHLFATPGTYDVCLTVYSCAGRDTMCKAITAVTPSGATEADFYADNTRPAPGQIVTLFSSTDKANSFEWYITPEADVEYVNGTDKNSKNPMVKLKKAGCYDVMFKAWNSANRPLTTNTIVKSSYLCLVEKCTPSLNFINGSVGANMVTIKQGTTSILVSNSTTGVDQYSDYSEAHQIEVLHGASYDLEISRTNTLDPWNARVWLDENSNGVFESGEKIIEIPKNSNASMSATLTIPNYTPGMGERSTLRIGIGYNNQYLEACSGNIGEYEDYMLTYVRDQDIPVITVLGGDTVEIERTTFGTYTAADVAYAGFTAWDDTEKDISTRVTKETNLEEDRYGVYYINYNVMDASGNKAATKTRIVRVVEDNTPPVIKLVGGDTTLNVHDINKCGRPALQLDQYVEYGATATDNRSGNITSLIVIQGNVDVTTVGTYVLTYKVSDAAGNFATTTRTIHVVDKTAPVIEFNGSSIIEIGKAWVDQTEVCDNYDNNVPLMTTPGISGYPDPFKKGTYTVHYQATDASGNMSGTRTRVYTVIDAVAPVISLNSLETVTHDVGEAYYSIKPTATDNFDNSGDIHIEKIQDDVNENVLGTYSETFVAKDLAGNRDTAVRYVKVVDRVKPTISGETYFVRRGTEFWPWQLLQLNDNYDSHDDLMKNAVIIDQNVNVWVNGIYTIIYEVSDNSGNISDRFHRKVIVKDGIEGNVGIDDVTLGNNINVYPVPSNGNITIDLNVNQEVEVTLLDALGKTVKEMGSLNQGTNSFDLTDQAKGVYFMRFTSGDVSTVKRVLLN